MPIATPEIYNEMLDKAKAGEFAYPAINVTSTETLNAALRGFAEAGSDGIVQVSTGGAEFLSGTKVKDMVTGAVGLAEFAHVVAAKYPINVALHTDHCPKDKLDTYVRPLLAVSQERVDRGANPLFQSHMWDGSATELHENLAIAAELLDLAAKAKIILEVEIGVVGGEEDGVANEINEKLYTSAADYEATVDALGGGRQGPLPARRHVRQRARRLQAGQRQAAPGDPQGGPGRGHRQARPGRGLEAVRPGLPRRLGLAAVRDRRGAELRRGEDERRHRHPVRVHPADRRAHVHATTTAC